MSTVNVLMLQADLYWQDVDRNLKAFEQKLNEMEATPDLVILPEMFSTGFCMDSEACAESTNGKAFRWMCEQAKRFNVALVGSVSVKEGAEYYNRCYFVLPDGAFFQYDKRHLFRMGREHHSYSAGEHQVIVPFKGIRFCLQICYDLRFPVFSRNQNNYDALIYVANWPAARAQAWKVLLQARAIENQAYVIGVNRVGQDDKGTAHSGDSCAYDFTGEPLVKALAHQEQSLYCNLDVTKVHDFRAAFPAYLDADRFVLVKD